MFSNPFSLPSRQLFNFLSRSQLCLTLSQGTLYWFGLSIGKEEEKSNMQLDMQQLQIALGRGRVTFSLSLSLHLYSPLNEVGCLGLV